LSDDDAVNEERRVHINIDNFTGAGTRRKSRRLVNEECMRKLKESNRWKIKEENERQLREEEERLIFVEVLRRIQKRDDLKMRDEFYDIDKLSQLNDKMIPAAEDDTITIEGLDFSALETTETVTVMMDSPRDEHLAGPGSDGSCTTSSTIRSLSFYNERKSESPKRSGDEADQRITSDKLKRSDSDVRSRNSSFDLRTKSNSFRSNRSMSTHSMTQDTLDEGIVERLREGIEKNMQPKKIPAAIVSGGVPGGDRIAEESSRKPRAAGAFTKPILHPTRSKLMEEYEKNIKVEIDIKVAMLNEKKIRTKDDINVIIKTTKKM
jgi:hypothetical protein